MFTLLIVWLMLKFTKKPILTIVNCVTGTDKVTVTYKDKKGEVYEIYGTKEQVEAVLSNGDIVKQYQKIQKKK